MQILKQSLRTSFTALYLLLRVLLIDCKCTCMKRRHFVVSQLYTRIKVCSMAPTTTKSNASYCIDSATRETRNYGWVCGPKLCRKVWINGPTIIMMILSDIVAYSAGFWIIWWSPFLWANQKQENNVAIQCARETIQLFAPLSRCLVDSRLRY